MIFQKSRFEQEERRNGGGNVLSLNHALKCRPSFLRSSSSFFIYFESGDLKLVSLVSTTADPAVCVDD